MKRAFFFALIAPLLLRALSQPASATGRISVHNAMGEPIKVDIIYKTYLCRDDHPTIATGGTFSVQTGACMIESMTASWSGGKRGPGVRALGASYFVVEKKEYPTRCQVNTR